MPRTKKSKRSKKGGNQDSMVDKKALRDMGVKSFEIFTQPSGRREIFSKKVCTCQPLICRTDSSGNVSSTSLPVQGTTQLGMGLFVLSNTLMTDVDMVRIDEWGAILSPVSNNQGSSAFWWDWDDAGNSTSTEFQAKHGRLFSNSNTSATAYPVCLIGRPPRGTPYNQIFNPNGSLPYTASFKWYTEGTGGNFFSAGNTTLFTLILFAVVTGYGYV